MTNDPVPSPYDYAASRKEWDRPWKEESYDMEKTTDWMPREKFWGRFWTWVVLSVVYGYQIRPFVLQWLGYPQPQLSQSQGDTSATAGMSSVWFDVILNVTVIGVAFLLVFGMFKLVVYVGNKLLGDAD